MMSGDGEQTFIVHRHTIIHEMSKVLFLPLENELVKCPVLIF